MISKKTTLFIIEFINITLSIDKELTHVYIIIYEYFLYYRENNLKN